LVLALFNIGTQRAEIDTAAQKSINQHQYCYKNVFVVNSNSNVAVAHIPQHGPESLILILILILILFLLYSLHLNLPLFLCLVFPGF
jgi:hypothetical protein